MRIVSKGGVWKNTEDEILKAAVMKYGKNQWARISSLLVRKSAKQCKARWYEWLDPSIKKTEWSREEEEKLLHLAKIMPNQWRTIAPIVGRTASQCLEHYEKLLDAATHKEEDYDPSEDPRRLRPGEIDPNPEAKPARPDPVDMDEDEKEMLSEARARLANTKGKKAKRKAREKQLEEARRLAALQKRRELKAAGIELPKPKRKIKGINYNKEIPFQKKPPPGFYEVDFSDEKKEKEFKSVSLDQLEGKRRRDEEEEARQEDKKKQKKNQERDLAKHIMKINKLNEPEQAHQRSKLMLPNPQLSERELEEFSKMNATYMQDEEMEGSSVTKTLQPLVPSTPARLQTPGRPLPQATPSRQSVQATPILPSVQSTPARGGFPQSTPARDSIVPFNKKQHLSELKKGLQSLPKPQNEYKIELPELAPEPEQATTEEEEEEDIPEDPEEYKRRKIEEQQKKDKELASKLILEELNKTPNIPSFEEFEKAWNQSDKEWIFSPKEKKYIHAPAASNQEKVDSVSAEFETILSLMNYEANRAKKMETKLNVYHGGYQKRSNILLHQITATFAELDQVKTELECFSKLRELENNAMTRRMEKIKNEIQTQQSREAQNQLRYKNLMVDLENLTKV